MADTYLTRPRTVTATRFLGQPDPDNTFFGRPTRYDPLLDRTAVLVASSTLSKSAPAFAGDWIVKDQEGNLSVLSHAEFTARYQSAEEIAEQQAEQQNALAEANARVKSAEDAEAALQAKIAAADATLNSGTVEGGILS